MSVNQILDELSQLDVKARRAIFRRLVEIDPTLEENESPELLEAIDAGIRSLDAGEGIAIEEVRKRMAQWTTK